jgi:hypothetical protein
MKALGEKKHYCRLPPTTYIHKHWTKILEPEVTIGWCGSLLVILLLCSRVEVIKEHCS